MSMYLRVTDERVRRARDYLRQFLRERPHCSGGTVGNAKVLLDSYLTRPQGARGMEPAPLVLVEWRDSVSDPGQQHPDTAERRSPLLVQSAGYIVAQDDDRLVIAQSVTEGGDFVDTLTIPAGAIVRTHRPYNEWGEHV